MAVPPSVADDLDATARGAIGATVARLWWLAVLVAPWSVEVPVGFGGWRLAVPQEPLLVVIVLMAIRTRRAGLSALLRRLTAHPVGVIALALLAWTAVAAGFSTAPVVSAKVLLVRGLQAAVYFGLGLAVVRTADDARRVARVGAWGLAPIAVWALVRSHLLEGWQAVHASAQPFFYSRLELTVVAAFWLLALVGPDLRRRRSGSWPPAVILVTAVVALRGRAALVGLVSGLFGRWLALRRPRPAVVAAAAVLGLVGAGALALDLALWRESSGDPFRPVTALEPVWRSVAASAPAVDESARERLNRWRCALLMAADRPLTGFGPGTFERSYGVYQRDRDRTRWSTDAGDLGDAHSEAMGRLAEEGVVGLVLQVALFAAVVAAGLRAVRTSGDPGLRGSAASWTGAAVGLAAASVFVGVFDLPGTGLAPWLAAAVVARLDLEATPAPPDGDRPSDG